MGSRADAAHGDDQLAEAAAGALAEGGSNGASRRQRGADGEGIVAAARSADRGHAGDLEGSTVYRAAIEEVRDTVGDVYGICGGGFSKLFVCLYLICSI